MKDLSNKAKQLDQEDPLRSFRTRYHLPQSKGGDPLIYFCGNSLGLQPKITTEFVMQELNDWKELGVEGHFHAAHPWMPYHEFLSAAMAEVVGGNTKEVVVMNSLTVNLHLLMVSFYRPSKKRFKICIEEHAFPSDRYAVASQAAFHGYDPDEAVITIPSSPGKAYTTDEDMEAFFHSYGEEIALVLLGGVNYYSGQYFPIKKLVQWAKEKGCVVGLDLAHAAGNIDLSLHKHEVDFAAWCTYKYLNSGPGGLSGIFVHESHLEKPSLPRFAGWWGHDKKTRFQMPKQFQPMPTAEAWQLSNPPILPMAALRASLSLFSEVGMSALRQKSIDLTSFLEEAIRDRCKDQIEIITPDNPQRRGCQLSLRIRRGNKAIFDALSQKDIVADWREPDVIRIAPVPMYNTYAEACEFANRLYSVLNEESNES